MISRNTISSLFRTLILLGMLGSSLGVSALSQLGTDFVGSTTNTDFIFNQNNTERMRITTGGYVKIATSGGYLDYRPNNIACSNGQVLSWDNTNTRWICSNDAQGIAGSGLTTNRVTKWNGSAIANSQMFDNGTNVGVGTTAPSSTLDVGGTSNSAFIQNLATWGLNARTQGLVIAPEGDVTDNGAGSLTFGSTVIIMNPLAGSYIRVAAGTYTLGAWDALWAPIPPTGSRGTTVTPTVTTWADGDRNYDGRDRVLLALRNGAGKIVTRFGNYANTSGANGTYFTTGNVGIGTTTPGTALEVAGTVRINSSGGYFDYRPNATACANGQILSWDNTNNRWICTAYAQGVTGSGQNNAMAKWIGGGTGATLTASSDIFESGGNVGIGISNPQTQLHIDSGVSGVSGVRFTQLTAATTPTLQANAAVGVDSGGNLVAIPPGNVAVYTGIDRAGPPTPNPNTITQEVSYDFNRYFDIPGKTTFVVTNGSSPSNNGPYFQENGSNTPCSWTGPYGTSPVDCVTTDAYTSLSASPYNSFTMTAKGNSFGYQLALGARGDAPLFARAGRYVNGGTLTNIGSGLYLNDGTYRTPSPWMKVIVTPAAHPEYFFIDTGFNSQWNATTSTGYVGIGTTFPDIKMVVAYSGSVGSTARMMRIERGPKGPDSSMVTTYGTPYLLIGGKETRTNSLQTIGFGYNTTSSYQPAEIGFLTTSTTGNTQGDLVFALRNGTGNTLPTEDMRITSAGNVGIGTSNPAQKLDVAGNVYSYNYLLAPGNGLGLCFWNDCNTYKISMGNSAEFVYGSVTGYSVKNTMNNIAGWGWTWGTPGATPVAAMSVAGDLQLASNLVTGADSVINTVKIGLGNNNVPSNTAIGFRTLRSNTTGSSNTAVGYTALINNTTGSNNVAVGDVALNANSSGSQNTAIGSYALTTNTTGNYNVANGYGALYFNSTGSSNTAIGLNSMYSNTSGGNNTALGYLSLYTNTTGNSNVAAGNQALYANTTGASNLALGNNSLSSNNTGSYNVAIGEETLTKNGFTGSFLAGTPIINNELATWNTGVGYRALINNTTGSGNTAIGAASLSTNTGGSLNTAIGFRAGPSGSNGLYNTTAIGANTIVTASNSVVLGNNANVGIGISNPSAKLEVNGTVKITDGSQGAGKVLTSDANGLASWQTSGINSSLFNNMGQNHGTQTDFNTPTDFGFRYIQGSTNGPGISGAGQYYNMSIGLGAEYPYSQYAMQFAIPRTPVGGNPYPSVRFREGGSWGSWSKIYAGYADTVPVTGVTGPGNLTVTGTSGQRSTVIGDAGYGTSFAGLSVQGTITGSNYSLLGDGGNLYVNRPGGDMYFREANTDQVIIKASTGRMGIGTTTPGAKLEVAGSDAIINTLTVGKGGGNLRNQAVGSGALRLNSSGIYNTANGEQALEANTTGSQNTADGFQALMGNSTGSYNTAMGYWALVSNKGDYNTAIGYQALMSNLGGTSNVAVGPQALTFNTTGLWNIGLGYQALYLNTTGNGNIGLGYQALWGNRTGLSNIALGSTALFSNSGGSRNVSIGENSMSASINTNDNIAIGHAAMARNQGSQNTAVGRSALENNINGWNNTAFGHSALYSLSGSASANTAVGYFAGYGIVSGQQNVVVGQEAGSGITTGSNNIAIGFGAQVPTGTASNQIRIGNPATTYAGVQVAWTVTSDRKWKKDIQNMNYGLDFIDALQPVSYIRKNSTDDKREFGLIAQDVEKVFQNFGDTTQGMLSKTEKGEYELRYNDLFSPIIRAIQELGTRSRAHDSRIDKVEAENKELKKEIEDLRKMIEEVKSTKK